MSVLSKITGQDAAHNASIQMNSAAQQAQEAATDRNQAQQGFTGLANAGTNGLGTAGVNYGNVASQGAGLLNSFTNALPGLTQAYEQTAGLQNSNGTLNGSPYSLTPAQQTELNGQVDSLNRQGQSAAQHYTAAMASRGLTDPGATAAGLANIANGYSNVTNQAAAGYMNTVQQQKQGAEQNLLNYLQGVGSLGLGAEQGGLAGATGQIQAGNEGIANLAGQAQGAQAQSYQQANQQQAQSNAALGNLLGLATFGLNGGFDSGSSSSSDAGASATDVAAQSNPVAGYNWQGPVTTGNPNPFFAG